MDEREAKNLIKGVLKKLQNQIELHKLATDDMADAVVFALEDTIHWME